MSHVTLLYIESKQREKRKAEKDSSGVRIHFTVNVMNYCLVRLT